MQHLILRYHQQHCTCLRPQHKQRGCTVSCTISFTSRATAAGSAHACVAADWTSLGWLQLAAKEEMLDTLVRQLEQAEVALRSSQAAANQLLQVCQAGPFLPVVQCRIGSPSTSRRVMTSIKHGEATLSPAKM
jgi:hypothetical protein